MTATELPAEEDLVLLGALADGELEPQAAAALERRIAAEPALAKAYDAITATRQALSGLERPAVRPEFLRRIESAVGLAPAPVARRRLRFGETADWRALAASLLVAVLAAGSGGYWIGSESAGIGMADQVAGSHRRSLLAASPVDVASSDRHTVKPWLDARIGLSPPAPDLAAKGFPLVGGRVDVIAGRVVPTLVYRHNEHVVTLVAEPSGPGTSQPRDVAAEGYNMVRWSGRGFGFWAVSDLEQRELEQFAAAYRASSEAGVQP